METQTPITESNDLRHKIYCKDVDLNDMIISIRLNDECKNGHQDFSITADGFKAGRPRTNSNFLYGGCAHDEILKVRPDLKIFVNLHLCDYTGVPMHAVGNGLYHLRTGFNNTKPDDAKFIAEYCDYYRISREQFDILNTAEDELRFALLLQSSGVLAQWKQEADKGISMMEEFTGKKFLVDSVKTQYQAPTEEQVKVMEEREQTGYYLPENIAARENAKREAIIKKQYEKITKEREIGIEKVNLEYRVKMAVLYAGLTLENFIFYNHSKEGAFNWKGYGEQITKEQFEKFINSEHAKIEGVTWKMDKK